MNQESEFPFDGQRPVEDHRARRVTPEENQKFRAAIAAQFGVELEKRDRPSKEEEPALQPGTTYPIWSPLDSHEAADKLAQLLESEQSNCC
jgi:hypothetical protein